MDDGSVNAAPVPPPIHPRSPTATVRPNNAMLHHRAISMPQLGGMTLSVQQPQNYDEDPPPAPPVPAHTRKTETSKAIREKRSGAHSVYGNIPNIRNNHPLVLPVSTNGIHNTFFMATMSFSESGSSTSRCSNAGPTQASSCSTKYNQLSSPQCDYKWGFNDANSFRDYSSTERCLQDAELGIEISLSTSRRFRHGTSHSQSRSPHRSAAMATCANGLGEERVMRRVIRIPNVT
jgi:hypothetical protein